MAGEVGGTDGARGLQRALPGQPAVQSQLAARSSVAGRAGQQRRRFQTAPLAVPVLGLRLRQVKRLRRPT